MRIPLWITIGLIISAISVSALGAYFSVVGLGALFSGAALAVFAMAGALELSKFVLAAYIHQRWTDLAKGFKYYITFAIVTLSFITSLGIFGFLSNAYQSASTAIQSENIRLDTEKNQMEMTRQEIARLNKAIDEVPDSRISRKMKLRAENEPFLAQLSKKMGAFEKKISDLNLNIVELQKSVGPLIYISRAFNIGIDSVVKYLIFVFVLVFDPLAICLVIASSQAISSRSLYPATVPRRRRSDDEQDQSASVTSVAAVASPAVAAAVVASPAVAASLAETPAVPSPAAFEAQPNLPIQTPAASALAASVQPLDPFDGAEIIEMSFEDPAQEVKKLS